VGYNADMLTNDLQHNINWLLLRASLVAKQRLIKISEDYDLSPMQALTICLLEPGDTVPMSAISELLVCDASNVTGIVERLSNGSYIERKELSTIENNAANLASLSEQEIETLKDLLIKVLPVSTCKYLQRK
jgi:hypothetical protein